MNTFIMVGHETTAGSLAFTLLELARNPAVQQRLRDEIRQMDSDILAEEANLGDYKRATVRSWMGRKFGGLLECCEKGSVRPFPLIIVYRAMYRHGSADRRRAGEACHHGTSFPLHFQRIH